jgi:hypothetical protein
MSVTFVEGEVVGSNPTWSTLRAGSSVGRAPKPDFQPYVRAT